MGTFYNIYSEEGNPFSSKRHKESFILLGMLSKKSKKREQTNLPQIIAHPLVGSSFHISNFFLKVTSSLENKDKNK